MSIKHTLLRHKKFSIFILVLISIVVGYAFNANYYYPELNTKAVQFLIKDKPRISEQDNSVYSIIGLNAPDTVQNIHTFGLNLVNETLSSCLNADGKHLSLDARLPEIENELTLNADMGKLHCWINNEKNTKKKSDCVMPNEDSCYTEKELSEIVKNNEILINRHDQLKKYKKYDDNALFATNGQLLINTHRLYLANIRLNIEQGDEQALQLLIQDFEYHRTLMSHPGSMIDKAIKLVLYNLSLEQLEHVIIRHTDVALKYKKEINVVLSKLTMEEFNLDAIFREEFEIINSLYCLDERLDIDAPEYCQNDTDIGSISVNYIINDFYEFYLSYKRLLNLDMKNMTEQCSAYSNELPENLYLGMLLHLPILSTYTSYNLFVGGMKKGCELMISHKQKALKHVELKAYLNSKDNSGAILNAQ